MVRALRAGGEPRKRATSRLLRLVVNGLLEKPEWLEAAETLWDPRFTSIDGLPDGTTLYDWAFLVLPEPESGMASRRFRSKWLANRDVLSRLTVIASGTTTSVNIGESPSRPDRLEDTLWNIGLAIHQMKRLSRPLMLVDTERNYLVSLVSQWVDVRVPSYPIVPIQEELESCTSWAVEALSAILQEVEMPLPVAVRLFEKLKALTDCGISAYGPVGGLIAAMPGRASEFADWLRTGMASGNRDRATGALLGLSTWFELRIMRIPQ